MVYNYKCSFARIELFIFSGKNAAAALVVHLGALVLMLTVFKLNVYALVGSNIVFAVIMCVLNQRKIRQVCGFRINIRRTFVKPLIASAIMGVITYAVHFGLHRLIGGRVIPDCFGNYRGSYCLWSPYFKIRSSFGERYSGASDGNTDIERMSGAEIDAPSEE